MHLTWTIQISILPILVALRFNCNNEIGFTTLKLGSVVTHSQVITAQQQDTPDCYFTAILWYWIIEGMFLLKLRKKTLTNLNEYSSFITQNYIHSHIFYQVVTKSI